MPKTFNILVVETLSRSIEIKAETVEEAIAKVEADYDAEKIVLDAGDFAEVEIRDMENIYS